MQLESMYQEIILDHYRHPHHQGLREPYDGQAHHVNPTCGDEITVRVRMASPNGATGGPIRSAAWSAAGAAAGPAGATAADASTAGVSAPGTGADGEPVVTDVSYDALGCAISQASASVMTDLVIGKSLAEAFAVADAFVALMQSRGDAAPDEDKLEDAVAFVGVAKYPARIKCALLSWMAWKDATARALGGKVGQES
jgi:nitrogen fixation NifU-like protein